jgi:hypothetical protein
VLREGLGDIDRLAKRGAGGASGEGGGLIAGDVGSYELESAPSSRETSRAAAALRVRSTSSGCECC